MAVSISMSFQRKRMPLTPFLSGLPKRLKPKVVQQDRMGAEVEVMVVSNSWLHDC
jgi:hypothetical protein